MWAEAGTFIVPAQASSIPPAADLFLLIVYHPLCFVSFIFLATWITRTRSLSNAHTSLTKWATARDTAALFLLEISSGLKPETILCHPWQGSLPPFTWLFIDILFIHLHCFVRSAYNCDAGSRLLIPLVQLDRLVASILKFRMLTWRIWRQLFGLLWGRELRLVIFHIIPKRSFVKGIFRFNGPNHFKYHFSLYWWGTVKLILHWNHFKKKSR